MVFKAKKYGGYSRITDPTPVDLIDDTEGTDTQGDSFADLLARVIPDLVTRIEPYTLDNLSPPQKLPKGTMIQVSSVSKRSNVFNAQFLPEHNKLQDAIRQVPRADLIPIDSFESGDLALVL